MKAHKLVYNDTTHTYTLDGRRSKSVTAVAKMVADSWALDQWRKRQVAIGMMLEPRLAERVAVDPDNKEAVDEVCEEALRVAGAHHAANRGTQRHRASELFDTGGRLLTDQQRADAAAWQATLDAHGIEIVPELVEGFAIWPSHGVVGRFDRIARYRGRHIILDLKSGENAVKYPHSTSAQLSIYANAPLISAKVVTTGDRSTVTEWRTPPADIDLEVGYVILLGDGMDIGQLWAIDIAHGMAGARSALELVDWRKAHNYGADLARLVEPGLLAAEPTTKPAKKATKATAKPKASKDIGSGSLGLHALIKRAASVEALEALWVEADRDGAWRPAHTEAAKHRKSELLAATGQAK